MFVDFNNMNASSSSHNRGGSVGVGGDGRGRGGVNGRTVAPGSSFPKAPMEYINMFTNENVQNNLADQKFLIPPQLIEVISF